MDDSEIWKDVIGFEQYYEVSSLGRVKSKLINNKYILPFLKYNAQVVLRKDGKQYCRSLYKIVCEAFNIPLDRSKRVIFKDGNKLNNSISNIDFENIISRLSKNEQLAYDRTMYQRPEARERYKLKKSTLGYSYSSYKATARKRGIDFFLTKTEFSNFWQAPCYYCNSPITTIGVDRIDSSKAYEFFNVRSCCTTCNTAKLDHSEEFFYLHIDKIYNFIKSPRRVYNLEVGLNRKHAYINTKCSADIRKLHFALTKEDVDSLITSNCVYCGSTENIGIDRIDSSKGYILDNCVSCCPICNRMKMTLSESDFRSHIIKIYNMKAKHEII